MSLTLDAYNRVLAALEASAGSVSLSPPQLMVVSKNQAGEALIPLLEKGHCLFGENRVQEARHKWLDLKKIYPCLRLHLIGPLQRNKVPQALGLFHTIETIDRHRLVDTIIQYRQNFPQVVQSTTFLIQVNIGQEPQKSGVDPYDLGDLYYYCLNQGLLISGFMCIPPANKPPAPYFEQMQQLKQKYGVSYLSMGMSDDYALAAKYGSSWVRVGSAIFGDPR